MYKAHCAVIFAIAQFLVLTFGLKLPNHADFWGVFGCLVPWTMFFVIETPKRHILGWIRIVWCIDRVHTSTRFCCRRRQEKKGRQGKGRYTKSQLGYISPIWGADPFGPICTKLGTLVGIHDVIIQSKFGFNILRGFRSTGVEFSIFPLTLLVILTTVLLLSRSLWFFSVKLLV